MHEQFFFARSGTIDVDGGPHTLVHESAIQVDLHVAGAFELFKDHVVHAAAGVDQGRRENRQAAAFYDTSRCTKKASSQQRRGVTPPLRILPEAGISAL
jgi:hypothetical protein